MPSRVHRLLWLILAFLAAILLSAPSLPAQVAQPALISLGPDGLPADSAATHPSISDDGRFVVYESAASNLQPGDANGLADVFLYDRQTGETRLISVSPAGVQGDGASGAPVISGNGRMIVFQSAAANLVEGDTNGVIDIFAFDRLTGLIRRVSVGRDGSQADGASLHPDIDYAGRYLVFESEADNLVPESGPGVHIYDLVTENVIGLLPGRDPVISGDGRIVAFTLESGEAVLYHRVLGETELRPGAVFPQLSFTGRNLAFSTDGVVTVLDRQEGGQRVLSERGELTGLRLSPDAGAAAYLAAGDVLSELRLVRPDGEMLTVVRALVDPVFDIAEAGAAVVFSATGIPGSTAHSQIYLYADAPFTESFQLAGRVTDAQGRPLGLVTIADGAGGSTRTDAGGYFYLAGYPAGLVTLTPFKEGFEFDPIAWNLSVIRDVAGYLFTASPQEKLLEEARLDIGMPYSFDRGCNTPDEGCGGPYHGFTAGYCTDLVLDAYTFGLEFDIDYALEQDAYAHPDHFYRWRDARDAHDMWRYFHFSGQMLPAEADFLPGDVVFFDWSGDGEIDHVALVGEVEFGRPVTLVDATGVTEQNPTGLAAELDWLPFHTNTFRGHARWNGLYEPVFSRPL